ncbi:ATP-binding protein [Streptomyces sp. M2CJ-2]|uniref:ATP-binding protein n=1 Tax=Streptomyces sp. M2CJ-2 TaxID=2803948 RepID=UPI001928F49C|nr:ATP-binding protein [Streptomyces sp. M2CJ-2]MBL3666823.1 ATP-binding protein [Streptomyces sp. M2CJ-2]
MASIDEDGNEQDDNEQDGSRRADGQPTGNQVTIGGDATAPVIAGNHIAYIGAQHGSTVNVLVEGERPRPRRRERVELPPRRQSAPVGRAADLASIEAALQNGRTVQLWGPAGVGKSALLRHAARTLGAGPNGKLFLDAAGREPEDLAQDIFEACHETHGYAPSHTELRHLMAGMEVTVYVDNADYTEEQLRKVMDAAPDATFVFAGRANSLLGSDSRAHRVQGIDRLAAMLLLASELGRPLDESGEQDIATALWETASGTPLLLLRAAAVARLDPSGESVLPRPGAVRELLPPLFDRLDGSSLRALHLLATFGDAELAPVHIGALSETPDPASLCEELARLGLAQETELGYRVATDVIPALRQREGLVPYSLERLCAYFAEWAARPTTQASQVSDQARAFEVLAELAERSGRDDLAVRLVRAASPALARSLRFGVWGRLLDRGLPAAQRDGDRQSEAYFTHERGIRNILTGNRTLAAVLLVQAGVLWRQLGDTQGAEAASAAQQYVPQQAPPPDTGAGPDASAQGDASTPTDVSGSPTGADATPGPDAGSSGPDPTPVQNTDPSGFDPTSVPDVSGSVAPDPTSVQDVSSAVPDPTSLQNATAPGTGMPVDPGPAASSATGAPPPGLAETGTTLTGGGTAAGGGVASAGAAVVLKVAAVIAAVAIGAVAIQQNQDSSDPADSAPDVTVTTPGLGIDNDGPTDAVPAEPEPDPTGLAGRWLDSEGSGFEFVEAGPGSYTAQLACGDTVTAEPTGSGDTYTFTAPGYDAADGSCGDVLGEITTTITIAPDGDTAEATREMTSTVADGVTCTCTPYTLTRVP